MIGTGWVLSTSVYIYLLVPRKESQNLMIVTGGGHIQWRNTIVILHSRVQPQIKKHLEKSHRVIVLTTFHIPPGHRMEKGVAVVVSCPYIVVCTHLTVIVRVRWHGWMALVALRRRNIFEERGVTGIVAGVAVTARIDETLDRGLDILERSTRSVCIGTAIYLFLQWS